MKSKKFGFLKHYKKIKIEGLNLNNIINKCIKNRIDLRNLRCNDNLESTVEIKNEDYNLSVSTYVEAEDTREKVDIVKLNAEIEEIVAREDVLRAEISKIVAEIG